jgi:sugar phosphate isomerase/epimerase
MGPIYIGTVLLEQNRWTPDKRPSVKVSEWAPRFAAAGFDGLELWEPHAAQAEPAEREALARAALPVCIFNSYAGFEARDKPARDQSVRLARQLGAHGMKLNFGRDPDRIPEYVGSLRALLTDLGSGILPLCECHSGTVLEVPENAHRILDPVRDRVGIIVHAFSDTTDPLRRWLRLFGQAVTHVHAAYHLPASGFRSLASCPDFGERLAILRGEGFRGSFTIEFAAGVGCPPEDRDALFTNAVADLQHLRSLL